MRVSQCLFPFLSGIALIALAHEGHLRAESQESDVAEVEEWLEEHVPKYMEQAKMPGFSIAVVKDDKTIYAEGFGSRDPKKNLPATADTLFGIGSITKSFVAVAIMQLVEQGRIRLDDPVSKHIPFEIGMPDKPITIHHLLTHSLGIPNLATSNVALYRGLGLDTGVPYGSSKDFYRFVNGAQDEVVDEPGKRFFYHNGAWRLLGHIVQEKSGMPFHRYVKEMVIDPLGMHRTTLDTDKFESDSDHIVPHLKGANGKNKPADFPYPNPNENHEFSFSSAAGGIVSSANEMTRYINAHIRLGALTTGQLASKESLQRMHSLQIQTPDGHYGRKGYGYGLAVTPDFLGHRMISHGGSIIVSTAYMAIVPDRKIGVILMGNSSGMPYSTIAESVLAILMGKDPAESVPALRIKERMELLEGNYEVYRGLENLKIIIKDGMLYMESKNSLRGGDPTSTPLIPEDPTLASTDFYTLNSGLKYPARFHFKDDGSVDFFYGRYCYHKKD